MTDREKLAHLIHHWVEHNEAHMAEYKRWADTAKKEGLKEVYGDIMEAVKGIEGANTSLKKAMKAVKP